MAKAAKPTEPDTEEMEEVSAPPKKSKKKLLLSILALALLLGGGAAAFFLLSPAPPPRHGSAPAEKPARADIPSIFVDLGQFTANLMREEEDRYLQVAISLKISEADLEEKINKNKPEILHRVNMLLQSKYPSELATYEGKEMLAQQIRAQIEYVLGLRKTAPVINAPIDASIGSKGITDVLFTSFIIQ